MGSLFRKSKFIMLHGKGYHNTEYRQLSIRIRLKPAYNSIDVGFRLVLVRKKHE